MDRRSGMNPEDYSSNASRNIPSEIEKMAFRVLQYARWTDDMIAIDGVGWTDNMIKVAGQVFEFTRANALSIAGVANPGNKARLAITAEKWWYAKVSDYSHRRFFHETWLEPA